MTDPDKTVEEAIDAAGAVHATHWWVTPWSVAEGGGWKQQPVVLTEGEPPFFADHPSAYIRKLESMHADQRLERGSFHTLIGQFKDVLDKSDWGP